MVAEALTGSPLEIIYCRVWNGMETYSDIVYLAVQARTER